MSDIESDRLLVDYQGAGDQLSVGRTTIYGLVKTGELCSVKIGRRSLITTASLEAYVERLAVYASRPPVQQASVNSRRRIDDDLLERVSDIYAAQKSGGLKAVQVAFGGSARTAARYVAMARAKGLLPYPLDGVAQVGQSATN